MKKISLLLVCIIAIASNSYAQRLIPGQRGLQLSVGLPITESKMFEKGNFTAEVAMTINHRRANHLLFGIEYSKKHFEYTDMKIPSETTIFEGGYMLNLLSDARKTVLLNTGVTAAMGYETVNRNKKLLPDGSTLLAKDKFVYGGAYHLALDIYVSNSVVVFMKGKCNVLWGSDTEMFRPSLQTGVRIIF